VNEKRNSSFLSVLKLYFKTDLIIIHIHFQVLMITIIPTSFCLFACLYFCGFVSSPRRRREETGSLSTFPPLYPSLSNNFRDCDTFKNKQFLSKKQNKTSRDEINKKTKNSTKKENQIMTVVVTLPKKKRRHPPALSPATGWKSRRESKPSQR
jgi:hypothetical protein